MEHNYFVDESIFQGVIECDTPSGKMMFEANGKTTLGTTYKCYVLDGKSYMFETKIHTKKKKIEGVYHDYLKKIDVDQE